MIQLTNLDRSPKLAELKAVYRRPVCRTWKRLAVPTDVVEYLRTVWDDDTIDLREDCLLICLTGAHEVIGWVRVGSGTFDTALVEPRLVFGVALQTGSAAIIFAHNHPSGRPDPSDEDRALTHRLADGAKLLRIGFLDHVILTRTDYFSFANAGLL